MNIVLAQLNFKVGDIDFNQAQVLKACATAVREHAADLVIFPELALSGYPPEDLLYRPALYEKIGTALATIQQQATVPLIIGYPHRSADGKSIVNRAALIAAGSIEKTYDKYCLPNYSVFDEKRYFTPGDASGVFNFKGRKCALLICEDLWCPEPIAKAKAEGAEIIFSINASPYHTKQHEEREAMLLARSRETGLPIIYLNLVGGQDELLFDGASLLVQANGQIAYLGRYCEEHLIPLSWSQGQLLLSQEPTVPSSKEADIYQALVLGVKDYVLKNGFKGAIIGLSGGIDSALTLAIACDALGPERVEAVMMPFDYTSVMSMEDAAEQARRQAVVYHVIPIQDIYSATLAELEKVWGEVSADTTEQNIQARSRGMLLMALSNKTGKIVLTTGNKSELAVGYATLYGDMAGGFDVLKDVPKQVVYQLANYRNTMSEVIPSRVIERPPSAELAPDQVDEDNLPPYDVLDTILEMYIEQDLSISDIVGYGFEESMVRKVAHLVDINEHKRRQAAPGIRISKRAFGKDRRYPITSGFRKQF